MLHGSTAKEQIMRSTVRGFFIVLAFALSLAAWSNPSVVWVDAQFSQGNCGGHAWQTDAFATIQDGVDAVALNGVVWVALGTYNESVTITTPLLLLGPAAQVDPNDPMHLLPTDFARMKSLGMPVLSPPPTLLAADITVSGIKITGQAAPPESGMRSGLQRELPGGMMMLEEENQPPTAVDDTYDDVIEDDMPYSRSQENGLTANDLDDGLPNGMLYVTIETAPAHGTFSSYGSTGEFDYYPD